MNQDLYNSAWRKRGPHQTAINWLITLGFIVFLIVCACS